ncbi:flagellin [Brevundimonas diminuta]
MSSSIHTNRAALQALQAANAAGRDLASAQNKVSTGLKVATAKDNGAVFAIAASMRADIGGWGAVKTGLNRAQSITDVALTGAERIGELLIELQKHAVALNDSLTGVSRQAVVDHMAAMIREIDLIARTTEFDGINLLTGRPTITTTTSYVYALPSSPLPQPAFSSMAALPPGSHAWTNSTVRYALPPSAQTPASFDQAVSAISGANSQTVVIDGGGDAGRVNLLLDAFTAPDIVEIWQNGVRVAATGQAYAAGGGTVGAGVSVTGQHVLSFDYDPANGQSLEFRFNEAVGATGTAWTVGGLTLQDVSEAPPSPVAIYTPMGSLQTSAPFDPPRATANPEEVAVALDEPPQGVSNIYSVTLGAGTPAGRIDMAFDAFDRPDTAEVWQNGVRVAATGQPYASGGGAVGPATAVSGLNTLSFDFDPVLGPLEFRFNDTGADADSAWVVGALSLSPVGSPAAVATVSASGTQTMGFGPLHLDVFITPAGETLRVSSRDLTAGGLGLDPLDFGNAALVLDRVKAALTRTTESSAYFGVRSKTLERSALFATKSSDALEVGVGNLVDADLGKESAKLQAAQIRQQLATQTLSIANNAPQWLLGLFKGSGT